MSMESRIESVAREVFSQVRTSVVLKMRFLDMAVFRLKPNPAPQRLATDGDCLFYQPVWLFMKYKGGNKGGSIAG